MKDRFPDYRILAAYYFMLVAYLVASYFPESRVWGFNWWACYPDWVRWALFGLGVLVPVGLRLLPKYGMDASDNETKAIGGDRKFFIYVGAIAAIFGILFYLLRAQTHFLGDGYTLLTSLATDSPLAMKTREYGESLSHIVLKNMIGGDGQGAAQLSYQFISITAGLLFVFVVALFARKLYKRTAERMLFHLGVCTGGYMLLSFGYVENYSLFVLSVLAFTLTGLLIAQEKTSRYWILPPLIAAVFFHVLGITLIPSALYLWIGSTRIGWSIRGWQPSTKLVALLPIMVGAVAVFHHFYTTSRFFRFAFVPLVENRFTVEGYTMFSINHLMDFANLLFLLLPGLLIVIVTLSGRSVRREMTQRPFIYLAILTSSVLGAAFIFDPRLGMPRDWDLFSFAGVPLGVIWYYLLLRLRPYRELSGSFAALSIVLGCLTLIPRAVGQALPHVAVAHFRYHAMLDSKKNMNARTVLHEYLRQQGDSLALEQDVQLFRAEYPEWTLNEDALSLGEEGQCDRAIPLFRRAVELNPGFWPAYANLGWCYLRTNQIDSAICYLEWSDGLNIRNSRVNCRMGKAYMAAGDLDRAEFHFLEAMKLDPTEPEAPAGMAQLCWLTGKTEEMLHYLTRLAQMEDATPEHTAMLGDYYLKNNRFKEAADAYRRALKKGLDSAFVRRLMEQHPELQQLVQ